jgi:hypothetical protein
VNGSAATMSQETWKCPTCAQEIPVSERLCPACKVTQVRRPTAAEEAAEFIAETAEIGLPHVIPEARFNVPLETGPAWSSGSLLVAESGFFLLSAKDGLDPAAVAAAPPQVPGRLGALSFALPRAMIKRVVHDRLAGHFVEIEGKKFPLRLEAAGWKALDAACDLLGIAHS